jgi:hypothetical protein
MNYNLEDKEDRSNATNNNSTEQSDFWAGNNSSTGQEISLLLCKPAFNCCGHMRPSLICMLSQMNPIYTSLTPILILFLQLSLERPCVLFPSRFLSKIFIRHNYIKIKSNVIDFQKNVSSYNKPSYYIKHSLIIIWFYLKLVSIW